MGDQITSQFTSQVKGYQVLERIGEGAYGAVYRARQEAVDREVTIKIILPEFANRPEFIRFNVMGSELTTTSFECIL